MNLNGIAGGKAGAYARNTLLSLEKIQYQEPIVLPGLTKSSDIHYMHQPLSISQGHNRLEVFPNPADDHIFIAYNLEITEPVLSLLISSSNGKTIKEIKVQDKQDQVILDTKDWKPGMYIVSLLVKGAIKESVKFTVL